MERFIILIALFSCLIAGATLYSCSKYEAKKSASGYTTSDFAEYVILKKKYKNSADYKN